MLPRLCLVTRCASNTTRIIISHASDKFLYWVSSHGGQWQCDIDINPSNKIAYIPSPLVVTPNCTTTTLTANGYYADVDRLWGPASMTTLLVSLGPGPGPTSNPATSPSVNPTDPLLDSKSVAIPTAISTMSPINMRTEKVMNELNTMQDACSGCLKLGDGKFNQHNLHPHILLELVRRNGVHVCRCHARVCRHTLEWNKMGKDNAWWSVLTEEKYKGKTILEQDKREFYLSGKKHIEQIMQSVPQDCELCTALDFGCGLGRLAFSVTAWFDKVTCVDSSVYHLHTASKELQQSKNRSYARNDGHGPAAGSRLSPKRGVVEFMTSSPNLLEAVGKQAGTYDFAHSVLVFQHMVAPLQQMYMEQMCDVLKPGGLGWI